MSAHTASEAQRGTGAGTARTAIVAASAVGRRHAEHLAAALPATVVAHVGAGAAAAVGRAWGQVDALVLCMATGAAVRLIAPLLADKRRDPAVVALDDAGAFAVALAGGHHGGNDLARAVAAAVGATPVVTTATDGLGLPSLDHLGAAFGLRLDHAVSDVAGVGAALLAGHPLHRHRARPWPTGPLPGAVEAAQPAAPGIVVTDEMPTELPAPVVVYRPPSLVVGVGASRGASAAEVADLIDTALAEAGLSPLAVVGAATVDLKADEPGIVEATGDRSWPVTVFSAEQLAEVPVPNPSEVVRGAVGTPSVAEAAALRAAGRGASLVVPKRVSRRDDGRPGMATVAVARRRPRGRLALVSTGPGAESLLPDAAREALAQAEVVVGLDQYVDRIRRFLRPGCEVAPSPVGDEVARARQALASARAGRSTVLLSGGDVGIYAMASPALERAGDDIDVTVVPGVTAAVAAAAVLGSPLGHDHCSISLSDLLTPWDIIRRRVRAAAEGDFVVSFYNPRSRGRHWQLGEALALLAEHRPGDTPVGVVRDVSRPAQHARITTLADFDPASVDMLTIVTVGSSQTRIIAGRMVTPRGYGRDHT